MTDEELEAMGFLKFCPIMENKIDGSGKSYQESSGKYRYLIDGDRLKAGMEGAEIAVAAYEKTLHGEVDTLEAHVMYQEAIQNLKTFLGIETINKGKEK